jgi:hypothetical protein
MKKQMKAIDLHARKPGDEHLVPGAAALVLAHGGDRISGLVLAHEAEPFGGIVFVSRANQAARSRLGHRGLLEHKCSGVHETGSTSRRTWVCICFCAGFGSPVASGG